MTKEEIWDKSKSDKFAKWAAFIQSAWLILQCIGRGIQKLAITPFEIFTLAFMVCTVATGYFWYHKPKDVERPVTIEVDWNISDLHLAEGGAALRPWIHTPMDFVEMKLQGHWERRPSLHSFGGLTRPLNREPDDAAFPPPDLPLAICIWAVTMMYCGIHVSG
jgi:squalene monooxygenase